MIDHKQNIERVVWKVEELALEGLSLRIIVLEGIDESVFNSTDPVSKE